MQLCTGRATSVYYSLTWHGRASAARLLKWGNTHTVYRTAVCWKLKGSRTTFFCCKLLLQWTHQNLPARFLKITCDLLSSVLTSQQQVKWWLFHEHKSKVRLYRSLCWIHFNRDPHQVHIHNLMWIVTCFYHLNPFGQVIYYHYFLFHFFCVVFCICTSFYEYCVLFRWFKWFMYRILLNLCDVQYVLV